MIAQQCKYQFIMKKKKLKKLSSSSDEDIYSKVLNLNPFMYVTFLHKNCTVLYS